MKKEYTDEEFDALVDQAMLLFDDELAKNNPKETYIQSLKKKKLRIMINGPDGFVRRMSVTAMMCYIQQIRIMMISWHM